MKRTSRLYNVLGRWPVKKLKRLQRHEMGIIIVVCLLAACLWAFAELADEVTEGSTHAFDTQILLALRDPADKADPLGPEWVEELGRDFTALGGVGVLAMLTLVVAGYLFLERKQHMALFLAVTVGTGTIASFLLKHNYSRPRPDLVPHDSYVYTSSFPSGHSMMAAVTYLTLAALLSRVHRRRRAKLYLLSVATLLTFAVGISRVYLGVHWPTDVLAGWTAGAAWALLCWQAARWLQKRGQIEEPGMELEMPAVPEVDEEAGIR